MFMFECSVMQNEVLFLNRVVILARSINARRADYDRYWHDFMSVLN